MDLVQITAIIGTATSLVCTLVMGMLGYLIKRFLTTLETNDRNNADEIKTLSKEFNDLKADLPLIYATREDFIRVMNKVEDKLDLLLYKAPKNGEREEE